MKNPQISLKLSKFATLIKYIGTEMTIQEAVEARHRERKYCHCDEPMHIPGYMMGAMMPCIVLGVIPAIVALFIGSLPLLAWGIFFIAAAAGDVWMTWLLTKENPKSMVLDHPSEAGFYIIEENNA